MQGELGNKVYGSHTLNANSVSMTRGIGKEGHDRIQGRPLRAEMLRERAARTEKNQTDVLLEELQNGDEQARLRA